MEKIGGAKAQQIAQTKFDQDHVGRTLRLCGLIEQLVSITGILHGEKKKIEEFKKSKPKPKIQQTSSGNVLSITGEIPIYNTTSETAIKSSIVFFQFAIIEAIINVMVELTIQINTGEIINPKTCLTQPEIDFITEATTVFDPKKGETIKKGTFKRLEDKIEQVPILFAKMMGQKFELSKNEGHWHKFKELKKLRDNLTHPKLEKIIISDKDIFDGSTVIFWLCENYFTLIQEALYKDNHQLRIYIDNCSLKLVIVSYHATLKVFDIKSYEKKHKELQEKITGANTTKMPILLE